ncbi:MAG TPA: class I SAM-dependent methyltransferase [Chthoniobacterales bacterium]|nr:class I SAM-dependent methyltransferase [Chthoniobacterales bacterium]
MPEYLQAWKLFRSNSDENQATAKFLLTQPAWPTHPIREICDLGCGDGRLLAEVLRRCGYVQRVRLVDPDPELLEEAETLIEQQFPTTNILALLNSVGDGWPRCAGESDVILAVHLVYLLDDEELGHLLAARPADRPLYVVLDAPTSVFTQLWRWTADKYFRRAKRAHELLQAELGLDEIPTKSRFRSRIPKDLLSSHELSDWLLSILCYRNMLSDVPDDLRRKVSEIIDRHTDSSGHYVECESVCYELPGRKAAVAG